jgi:hypothetical protein
VTFSHLPAAFFGKRPLHTPAAPEADGRYALFVALALAAPGNGRCLSASGSTATKPGAKILPMGEILRTRSPPIPFCEICRSDRPASNCGNGLKTAQNKRGSVIWYTGHDFSIPAFLSQNLSPTKKGIFATEGEEFTGNLYVLFALCGFSDFAC